MGWFSYQIYNSPKQELDTIFTTKLYDYSKEERPAVGEDKVLRSWLRGNVYYAAVERIFYDNRKPKEVWALVCLTHYSPRAKYDNFAYKDMDETMGPFCYDCPKSILDLLSPTENKEANKWRECCYNRIAKRKILNKLKDGARISFKSEGNYTSGISVGDTVVLEKYHWGRAPRWYCPKTGYRWSLNQIPDDYSIVGE